MGKMSELAAELQELRHCGEVLIGISDTLTAMFSTAEAEPEKAEAKPPKKTKTKPEKKELRLEEVRAVLAEKSRSGHTAEIKALLRKFGAEKLSELDPSKYELLLAEAEVI